LIKTFFDALNLTGSCEDLEKIISMKCADKRQAG
jgi:hypothetical protein